MKPIRKGSNPVKIPFAIKSSDRTFAAWADETRTAIRQLEARIPTASFAAPPIASSHPWKASGKGTGDIKVAPGKVIGLRSSSSGKPWYCVFASYAGGDIAVSASGWLYVVATVVENAIEADTHLIDGAFFVTANSQKPTSVTVVYSATAPASISSGSAGEIYIPLAEVTVASGIASVADQVLTHNPCLFAEVGHVA